MSHTWLGHFITIILPIEFSIVKMSVNPFNQITFCPASIDRPLMQMARLFHTLEPLLDQRMIWYYKDVHTMILPNLYYKREPLLVAVSLPGNKISAHDGIHEGIWEPAFSAKTKLDMKT
jgi:hypothetical protein